MSDRGNFFVVDRRCVKAVGEHIDGLSLSVAYLVLARFASGRNHSSTRAGMTALHGALALSRGRADLALKTLENAGFVSAAGRGGTRKIVAWGEMRAEAGGLSDRQRAVLARVKGKADPIVTGTDPDSQTAYALVRKGTLALTEAPQGKPRFKLPEPEYLFLPNSLVDGFREGDRPLARLRQIGDVRAVSTLMLAYQHANLPEDGGISPTAIRETFDRFEAGRWGQFTVWAFRERTLSAAWTPFVAPFVDGHPQADRERLTQEFWAVWKALVAARLIEHVGYITEGSDFTAQPIHPFPAWTGTEEERRVYETATGAALRMLSEGQVARACQRFDGAHPYLCPVPSHILDAQLVGIARPVHRANTSRTRAWARNFLQQCEGHAAVFADLGQSRAQARA